MAFTPANILLRESARTLRHGSYLRNRKGDKEWQKIVYRRTSLAYVGDAGLSDLQRKEWTDAVRHERNLQRTLTITKDTFLDNKL